MREILFRGFGEMGEGWVYGDLIHRDNASLSPQIKPFGFHPVAVIPSTVGQFTGLYDGTEWGDATEADKHYAYELAKKNSTTPESEWKGKKIFEGDVVSFRANYTPQYKPNGYLDAIVVWCYMEWVLRYGDYDYDIYDETDEFNHKSKIIGNIHESTGV